MIFIGTFRISLAPLVLATLVASACAHSEKDKEEAKRAEAPKPAPVKTVEAAKEVASKEFLIVNFPAGKSTLTESEKQRLANWSVSVPKKGNVAEYEILAWADKEYPTEGSKVAKKDAQLADQRAKEIQRFFKKDLISKADLNIHNMAQRPSVFSEMFKTEDFEVKSTFEETGAAPTKQSSKNFSTENKASKAVVLVKYE